MPNRNLEHINIGTETAAAKRVQPSTLMGAETMRAGFRPNFSIKTKAIGQPSNALKH